MFFCILVTHILSYSLYCARHTRIHKHTHTHCRSCITVPGTHIHTRAYAFVLASLRKARGLTCPISPTLSHYLTCAPAPGTVGPAHSPRFQVTVTVYRGVEAPIEAQGNGKTKSGKVGIGVGWGDEGGEVDGAERRSARAGRRVEWTCPFLV